MQGEVSGVVIIDSIFQEDCQKYKWSISGSRAEEKGRVLSKINNKTVRLHHFLFGKPVKGEEYDHINRNPLDNRKCNLRLCSLTQNQYNRGTRRTNTSGYKGVCDKNAKRFRARIWHNRKPIHLGYFNTKEEAAEAYNAAALRLQGVFACLNEIKVGHRNVST